VGERRWTAGVTQRMRTLIRKINRRGGAELIPTERIEKLSSKSMRATLATRLYRAGVPMPEIVEMGEWEDEAMSRTYIHPDAAGVRWRAAQPERCERAEATGEFDELRAEWQSAHAGRGGCSAGGGSITGDECRGIQRQFQLLSSRHSIKNALLVFLNAPHH
jgi:hypothetical protein